MNFLKPTLLFLSCSALFWQPILIANDPSKAPLLLSIEKGDISGAFHLYHHYRLENGDDDQLLTQLALKLIQKGFREDPESALLALFGAGISTHEATLSLFEEALRSPIPQYQIIALHFLGLNRDRHADRILIQSQGSPFLPIRIGGALLLAQRGDPQAIEIAETLMAKAPEEAKPLFPPLFAAISGPRGRNALRRMMQHSNAETRTSAILSAAQYQRDDLLPQIRSLSHHPDPRQKEACAFALGFLEDESSAPLLKKLALRPQQEIQAAAANSLYMINHPEGKKILFDLASQGNLMAILSLGKVIGSEDLLDNIARTGNLEQRCNALLALLERRDPRCYPGIMELLLTSRRDRALVSTTSPAATLRYWFPIDSASAKLSSSLLETSLQQQEKMLIQALELPENLLLQIARHLLRGQENPLIPTVMTLLENHATPQALELLKESHRQLGAPLVRHYALLALCRLNEGEEYQSELTAWIEQYHDHPMIQFRPSIPNAEKGGYTLTPQETSRFLIEAYETIASRRDAQGIKILLDAIETGNSKNRYVLAGLLLRALE